MAPELRLSLDHEVHGAKNVNKVNGVPHAPPHLHKDLRASNMILLPYSMIVLHLMDQQNVNNTNRIQPTGA